LREAGDYTTIFINQGEREATVLAVIGDEYMIEYEMPAGTTALAVLHNSGGYKSVSYLNVPLKWLRALTDAESDWLGTPQSLPEAFRNRGGRVPPPREMLEARLTGKVWEYGYNPEDREAYRNGNLPLYKMTWYSRFTDKIA
jgi:hypothetical protein